MTKRIEHPLVGDLELDCQVLHVPDSDQRLVIYTAQPGSPTREAFRKLRALDEGSDQGRLPGASRTAST